jgi:transposase-like protein
MHRVLNQTIRHCYAIPCRAKDGLKGFPDAINAAYPNTNVQTCIVQLVRHSLNFCGWKDRKAVAKSLKRIYQAVDDKEAAKALMISRPNGVTNTPQLPQVGSGRGRS